MLEHGVEHGHASTIHARHDVLRGRCAPGDDVYIHLEPGPGHSDRRPYAILFVHHVVLGQDVKNLPATRQRHGLGGVDRSSHVFSRNLTVLSSHGHDPAAVEPFDVGAGQTEMDRIDLHACCELGLLDRLLDRLHCGFEVHDDTAPDAVRLGHPDPNDVESTVVQDLTDNGRDLRRPDVKTYEISLFACHASSFRCRANSRSHRN